MSHLRCVARVSGAPLERRTFSDESGDLAASKAVHAYPPLGPSGFLPIRSSARRHRHLDRTRGLDAGLGETLPAGDLLGLAERAAAPCSRRFALTTAFNHLEGHA